MNHQETFDVLGNVDIYVIDQILKDRYQAGQSILDAGCGSGRNLKWFYQNDFSITGVDSDIQSIEQARKTYPNQKADFRVGDVDNLPFNDCQFDHIICSAVLHFAKNENHFKAMMKEMIRVLKPIGTLFIRVASDIGLDGKKPLVQNKQTNEMGRFYITRSTISEILELYPLELIEPVKTTNVQDVRAMTTLVFQKV